MMDTFDIGLAVVTGYFTWRGYSRGVLLSLASIAAPAVGVVSAIRWSPVVGPVLAEYVRLPFVVLDWAAYPLVFVAGVLATRLFARLSSAAMGLADSATSKLVGAAVGGVTAATILGTVLLWVGSAASPAPTAPGQPDDPIAPLTDQATSLFDRLDRRVDASLLGPKYKNLAGLVLAEVFLRVDSVNGGPLSGDDPAIEPADLFRGGSGRGYGDGASEDEAEGFHL